MCSWNCFPVNSCDKTMQKEICYHSSTETPTGCLIVLVGLCSSANRGKRAVCGKEIPRAIILFPCLWTLKCLFFAEFLQIKPVSCCCWKWKANIITKWKEPLCLQLTNGCMTHGKGSAPQYTLPDSGTQAGSPRWLGTFLRLSSNFHRSAARRRAQRSRAGSGRLVYLSRWRDGEWGESHRRPSCPVDPRLSLLSFRSNWFDSPEHLWKRVHSGVSD